MRMTTNSEIYDLIIVGGGPAGATAALYAKRRGLKTLLLDKSTFPRDKICGDALSGKAVTVLRELRLLEKVRQLPGAFIRRVTFGSPDGVDVDIDFECSTHQEFLTGFVIRRQVFDTFLFEEARKVVDACLEGFTVGDLLFEDGQVCGVLGKPSDSKKSLELRSHMVLGADGLQLPWWPERRDSINTSPATGSWHSVATIET